MITEDIKNVETIKGSIETVLEVIREVYKADMCALFLIMENMHEDEMLEIFEKRLKSIKNAYKEKGESMPQKLQEYWNGYNGNRENLGEFLEEIEILKFCFKEAQNPLITAKKLYPERDGKIWKYDYKNRPDKWVIFKEYTHTEPQESIRFEGLTAYSIRTGRELFHGSPSEIDAYLCTTHLQADREISPRCKMIVFLHLKNPKTEKIIGLLKIENYKARPAEEHKFHEDSEETKEAKQYLPLLEKLVEKSRKFYEEFSYEKLYGGMRLLELLKDITPNQGSVNQEIYNHTHHLFCAFYRKEYVGHEEIMTRVTNYTDDLAGKDVLNICPTGFFEELLERRIEYEDLMLYKTEGYRDHFMHQFHVFVTGYIILNHIGLDKICEWVNKSLKYTQHSLELNVKNILRIWFLTSFIHDTAYVFERFGKGMANFFKEEWGYSFAIEPRQLGLQLLDKKMPFSGYLAKILEFFMCEKPTNRGNILPCYLDSIIKMYDHGVLSALWSIEKFAKEMPDERITECCLSALAMSVHNANIFTKLKEGREAGISFESFPISFMLAFCDTLQIWGRTREIQEDVHPELVDVEFSKKEIRFKLFYKSPIPAKIPTPSYIKKRLVQEKNEYFRSSEFKFIIEFYGEKVWSDDLIPIDTVTFEYGGS